MIEEPITAEWLIEQWGYKNEVAHARISYLRNCSAISFTIYPDDDLRLRVFDYSIMCPPKTRDEFRTFAKFFGLEEKQG